MSDETKSLGMEPVPTSELTQGPSCPSGASPEADNELLEVIAERDCAESMLDMLANAVSEHFGVPIGEHSSANNPWHEAMRILNGEYKTKFDSTPKPTSTPEWIREAAKKIAYQQLNIVQIMNIIARHSPGWVKIDPSKKETLPEEFSKILVRDERGVNEDEILRVLPNGNYAGQGGTTDSIDLAKAYTHWMKFPS